MNSPVKTPDKLKPILIGMIFGSLAYTVYLKFLAVDELTATGLGWLFFPPQYPVLWVCPAPTVTAIVVCYVLVALFYGYIFLSFNQVRGAAISAFLISGCAFPVLVYLRHDIHKGLGIFLALLFWPAGTFGYVLDDFGVSKYVARISIETLSVAFWYAALISGVHTFFRQILPAKTDGGSQSSPASRQTWTNRSAFKP